jgi:anti-sigma factor RsiW
VDCRDVRNLLNAYSDGELDLVRHLQAEHHLAECTACAEHEQSLRLLRDAVASAAPYHRAPESLRARVLDGPVPPAPAERPRLIPYAAAGLGVAAAVLLMAGLVVIRPPASADDRVMDQLLASHVRSLQVDHLTDVASSDRHTVKPWFRGKLDFAPQVADLSADGFPLTGGRLDYVADRPVAALVYMRRQHVINLFTWPEPGDDAGPTRSGERQGFHVRSWRQGGMAYRAVSDLNDEELDEFVGRIRQVTSR